MGVKPGSNVAIWATNVPAVVHHLLGHHQDRRRAGHREHRLQDPRGGIPAAPVRHAHAGHDRRRARTPTTRQIINELCPELRRHASRATSCTASAFPSCATSSPSASDKPGCLHLGAGHGADPSWCRLRKIQRMAAAGRHARRVQHAVHLRHHRASPRASCSRTTTWSTTASASATAWIFPPRDRMMIQVPMFHCFGMVLAMTASMTHGATMCPMPYFSPEARRWHCITQEQITAFNGVPTMFIAMLQPCRLPQDRLLATCAPASWPAPPAPPELMQRRAVGQDAHDRKSCSVYGQTEACPGLHHEQPRPTRSTCAPRPSAAPCPTCECKIIDPETGEELPDGVDRRVLLARGYNIMKGYYKMPDATAADHRRERLAAHRRPAPAATRTATSRSPAA